MIASLFVGTPLFADVISLDSTSSYNATTNTSSMSWSHTITTSSNRMLIVLVGEEQQTGSAVEPSSVTFGAQSLTKLQTAVAGTSIYNNVSLWYLIAPNSGTATITVTYPSAVTFPMGAATSFFGVKQAAPEASGSSINNAGVTSTTVTTLTPGAVIVDGITSGENAVDLAPVSPQTSAVIVSGNTTSLGVSYRTAATAGSYTMSWTQTTVNRTAQAVAVLTPLFSISGTVFEDVNYGGGSGRTLAGSSGPRVSGATVELYSLSSGHLSSTTTASDGTYSFTGVPGGVGYIVRVLPSTVLSTRTGSSSSLVPVQTYRYESSWQTPGSVTNEVGGEIPSSADSAAAPTLAWTNCATENGTCSFSGTKIVRYGGSSSYTVRIATGGIACNNTTFGDPYVGFTKSCDTLNPYMHSASSVHIVSSDVSGVDFGFNFDTVTNTNNSGIGSLRQAITNARTLGGDASLSQSGLVAAKENLVFMIGNGTSSAGLRSAVNYFSGGVATITPTSALPSINSSMVINAQKQPGWTLAPIIELNGISAGGATHGFNVTGGSTTIRGFVINNFSQAGIEMDTGGSNTIAGNYIGTNAAGTAAVPNGRGTMWDGIAIGSSASSSSNVIGGSAPEDRNVISGNNGGGIWMSASSGNTVRGNYIGVNAAGTAAIANGQYGIILSGSANQVISNVISGNASGYPGIYAPSGASSTVIQSNRIGIDAVGSTSIPNGGDGILLESSSNTVGGTTAGQGNIIANNTGNGVLVAAGATGNAILGNSIYANSTLGIDLGSDGITANNGSKNVALANSGMDYPVFTSATLSGTTLTLAGYVGSVANQSTFASSRVEVFKSDNTAANGQGQTYLGFLTADASGNFSGTITGVSGLTINSSKITGTATDGSNNTSEFGVNATVTNITTLATGTDPSNVTLAPGGSATMADAFTFQTDSSTDTITAITVSLGAGASAGLSLVEITDSTGATVYGSTANPSSDTPTITLTTNITATTSATTYKIRVTPKTHANMAAPAGATYTVTALVSNWTGTGAHAGSDTAGATVTVDNLSPSDVTAATATTGNTQVSLSWTNPGDSDLNSIVVLRRTTSVVTDTPVEGTTYTVGTVIGSSTVACVVSSPTASCTDTGLTNGTAYYYKIFTKDSNGNYSATGTTPTGSPVTPNLTTLATGTDPSNATLAPSASATMADAFTFQTASGTDTITAITVSLGTGASAGLSLVEITDSTGATVYGSATNPSSDTPSITLTSNITSTTSATTYKIRVTPKTHANMAAPAGATYTVTALVSNWTGTYTHAGSDAAGATITVDNLSPGNVTAATATSGNTQVALAWTNPADADLGSIVVLRRTVSVVTDTPVEGATYTVGNTIGSSTVACVVSAPTASCTDTGLTNGTAYYYKIFTKDSNGNYSATGVVPTGSPVTPNVTTLATGTDPSNTTLAPGGAATMADAFTFQTGSGTDTITAITVSLGTGASAGLSLVEITDSTGATVYGSATNPSSDTPSITLTSNITATTSATTYKIRVTPKSHANMAAPAGATYTVTALVSGWTGTNTHAGSDTAGATITVDNLSPANVTAATATTGNTQVSLAWTNPADADFGSVVVLRSTSAVADTPVEGSTYTVGNTIGSSTVACVVSAPTAACIDTGLTNGTAYHYKVFAKDTSGNYSATGVVPTGSPVTPNLTTLATGTDPSNTTIAPGASATMADAFTFQTASGTDTITAVTVSLGTGASAGLSLVEITDSTGATVYGSATNPSSDTPSITLTSNITATTTATTYKIRVTPKSHANMAAPAGATYTVTALISSWTGTNAHAGSDTAGATITVDNLSPGNVTAATATAGNGQVSLAWTNPADADLGSIVVLRATSAVADTPVEGSTYTAGNTIGSSTVACVVSAPTAACTDTSLSNGTAYHYKIFTKDTNGNYSATGVVPTGSPVTPNVTTLATGTDPSNTTLAPGASATMADAFTFQTGSGTDTITALTLSLGTGASAGLSLVEITDSTGSTVYGSAANPSSDTPSIALSTSITATTSATTYKIRVTPKSHANMAAPAGATYTVTALVSGWSGSNTHAGSDTAGATITVDNLSPADVTSATVTGGNAQATVAWTNPADADLGSIIVLRRTTSAVTDTPVEGATYTVGNTIGSSTVACVVSAPTATCTDTGLTNGTIYYYKIFARDTNGNYSATGVVPTGSPVTLALTTIATGTDGSGFILPPGVAAVNADAFTLETSTGTDTITSVTVSLGSGAVGGISQVAITNAGGTVLGSVSSPVSDTLTIPLSTNITATTSATTYRVRILVKSHAAMPAPAGAEYVVTAQVTGWVGSNPQAGSDTAGATYTIDNLSTADVTAASATGSGTQTALSWTNPADADFASAVVLRRQGSAVADTPVEGASYSAGNTLGSSTVACVTSGTSCTDTGLTSGATYYYTIFALDQNGNYSTPGVTPTGSPVTLPLTTLATGTDPSNTTLAPGASATMADAFTLQTAVGTDTITAITVSLGSGASAGLSLVEITDAAGTTVYGSVANPVSDTPAITLTTNITATTSATTYKIRVTPKSHANMAAPVGATYTVTALVSAWTGTNAQSGSDTAGATITVDNLSPADVTSATVTGGNAQATVAWTNPADADLGSIIVLRRAASAVTDTPVEGTTYSVGNTIGSSTVACVVSAPTATCTDTGLTNGTTYYYKIFAKDTNGNYSATGTVPTGSPVTLALTTIATGTDGSGFTLPPGSAAVNADVFTLQTSTGTDTITSVTVALGTGAVGGISQVAITNTGGTILGSVSSPVSDTVTIPLSTNITATTTATTYRVRIFIKSHAAMAAPAGAEHVVMAQVTGWAGSNPQAGTDTAGATYTIDNLSPGDVAGASATGSGTQTSLSWTNPADADFASVVVLRRQGSSVADTPVEGASYSVGDTLGSSTVACVTSGTSCTDTGLSSGSTYYYKIFTLDQNGNYSTPGVTPTGSPVTLPLTTLATGTDPSNAALAPGGAATMADAFTFQTAVGTDAITAITVSLGTGASAGIGLVEITDAAGVTVYGSAANPVSDTPAISLSTNITATTSATTYKIRVTPKSHANMPAPAGATYSVTAFVSAWTGSNAQTGSDTSGTTVTIDNQSTANVSSASVSSGSTQAFLTWTNPADADFSSIVVLRHSGSAVTDVPAEGSTYSVGNTIGSSTVACAGSITSCTDAGLTTGTTYHYKIFASDTNGNYSTGMTPSGSPVTPSATITVTPTSGLSVTEAGSTATFTIVLTSQPSANVTIGLTSNDTTEGTVSPSSVTFTTANWNTPQTVTVTGVDDSLDDGDVAFSIVTAAATSADGGYNGLNASDVSVTTTDDDASGFTVTPTSGLTTTEAGGTATFTVVLNAQPAANVTVGLSSNDTTEGTVSPSSLTFTSANWNTPQTVTVTGVDDSLDDADIAYTIVTAAATSSDANYNGLDPNDVSVTNTDNDASGITVTPTSGLTTTEAGGTATFTVVLTAQPTANVTIGLSSSNTAEGTVSPASVTFTSGNWNTPQTVTVTGVDDALVDGDIAYSVVTAAAASSDANYNGMNPSDVSATNADNDAAGFTVTPTSGLTTTEASGTATFTIVLTSQPTANVTIGVSSSNTAEGTVSPSSVTFTTANWNTPQTVTVTGVDDSLDDGNISYSVITAAASSADGNYNTLNPSDVSVTNTDNDASGFTVSSISGNTTEAGGTATFTIVLNAQPTADVTVGVSSSNAAEGTVSPSSLTFTSANWNTPQTVTVTGVDDTLDDGDIAYSIVTAAAASADGNYNGLNPNDVSVTNTDNDASGFTVSSISGNTTEAGGTATFTVVLNAQPTANVTVGVSSSNTAEGTVSPSSLTFTSANWNTPQTVTVTGVDDSLDDGDIAYSIVTAAATSADTGFNGVDPADVSVTNTDNDASGITVTPTSGLTTTEAGGTATFTIVLNAQPTASVTIGLTSSNTAEGTVSPSSLTFTSGNWNTPQTVTVTGVDDNLDDGDIAYSIVTAAATSADGNYNGVNPSDVSVTNTDNDASGITVTPTSGLTTTEAGGTATFTIVLDAQPTANVTIGLSSSNTAEGTVSPSSVTFTNGNWNTPQTVTVTGVDDSLDDGDIAYSIVTAAATSADGNYNGVNASDVSVTNTDNDASGITVTPTSGLTTTEAGGSATFTIVLNAQPTANVTIGLTSSNTAEGTVGPSSVTFTSANWNTPQTVTVTGVDDNLDDGDIAYSIVTAAATSSDANYNGLKPSDVTVTNTDNDASGITVTPASGLTTTEAGGSATFTIVLNAQPTANVTIGLTSSNSAEGTVSPSSVTFTSANWNTPQTVTVTGADDSLDDGDIAYSVLTAAATSADANYNGLNAADVTATNTDNDASGITVTPTSGLTTTEAGGTATFTIVLNAQPTANVTIGLSSSNTAEGTVSPSSVTFTSANWNTPQTVTVTGVDDNLDDGDIAYSIVTAAATSSDGNYNGLNAGDVSVTNTDNDASGITVTPTSGLTTTEAGGTATFTVVLNAQPTANVTIGLTSSNTAEGTVSPSPVTFTSGNWSTPQTVTVTGVDDNLDDGDILYSIVTAAATSSDGNYNGLNAGDVSVTNTDNDASGITVTPTSGLTTTEAGGTATFTVVLNAQPTANVTIGLTSSNTAEGTVSPSSVTFTSGNWNTPQTVTVTGVDDNLDDGDIAYSIVTAGATSSDGNYNGLNPSDVTVTNTDNDASGITVTPTSGLTTTEAGGSATFTIVLNAQPTANVTIGLSSSNTAEGTVSPSSVTFTSANWNTPQTVTVTGVDDNLDDGDIAYSIVTAAATSSDGNYNGLNAGDVSVTNTDNDASGITVTPTSGLTTTEAGGTATFTVVLNAQPTANVTIGLSSSNTAEGTVSPSSVTFTSANWNTPQTVTVTGVDDSLDDGDIAYTIVTAAATSSDVNYNGLNPSDVTVTNTDNDASGITVTPTSGLTTTEAGGSATFTIVLNAQPTANVTIGLTSSNTAEGTVSPSSLTFTSANWNTPQTITVTGVDDNLDDGDVAYTIVTAAATSSDGNYNGLNPSDVTVTNTDNDASGITVTPTSGLTTTEAGGSATFTIVLNAQPTANVTIGLTSSNTAEGTPSPSSVTFTSANWNTPQTVTVTGVDDSLDDGDIAYTIVTAAATSSDVNYNGLNASDVTVTNTDNDASGITVTPTSGLTTTEAGGSATFTIVLNAQPTADVTIGLTSSNSTEGTISPSSVTFTSGNWNTPQTVTVTGVNDFVVDGAVTYTIVTAAATSADANYNGLNPSDVSASNTDNDSAGITVTPTSGLTTTEAGGTATFTVVLTSQPTANVTIGLSTSDPTEGTVSPASLVFTSANWNTPQTVTATGADDVIVDGAVAYTIVTAAATSSDSNYSGMNAGDVSVTNTDNDTAGFTVTPSSGLTTSESGGTATFTVVLNTQPSADVTMALSSSNTAEGTVLPASLTFTSANWNTPQTVTVTGVDDFVLDGSVAYTVVTAPAVSADSNYSGVNATDVSVTNTDNDTVASLQADLVVAINDGVTDVRPGQTLDYTVTVTNLGPAFVNGATLSVGAPSGASLGAWTCTATTGSSCSTASGTGALNTPLTLLANGVATLHIAATVSDGVTDGVTTTATVTLPAGQTDPVPANNTAKDVDTIEAPRIGVTLKAGTPTVSGPATFDVPYTIDVTNQGGVPATNLQVNDSLSTAFSAGKPSITMAVPPSGTAPCSVAGGFSGTGDSTSLLAGATLGVGQSCTITFTARVAYPTASAIPSTVQVNKVTATAGSAQQAHAEAEASVKLVLPRVDITQALTSVTQVGEEPIFDLGFRMVVRNTSEADAHNVQVIDDLRQGFSAGSPVITIQSGPVLELLTAPTALDAQAGSVSAVDAASSAAAGLTLAPDFNGTTVTTLLKGDDTLPAGREQAITMTVRLKYASSNAVPVDVDLTNTPVVTTSVTPGGTVITRDESTDVTAAAADPQSDDVPKPTVIRLTPAARLVVQKVASARVAEIGDTVQYAVRVSNVGSSKLPPVTVTDQLPIGFRYVEGSARLLGESSVAVRIPDPVSKGGILTFTLGEQPTNAATITYRLRLGPGADRSDGINVAQAASGIARSGVARAKVQVAGGVFSTDACIIGRVFADLDGNGVQRAGEPGLPGVRLTLEDGTTLISDGEGRYSYCGLSPTTHVIVADPLSLPPGATLVPGNHRNQGDGRSQFVDVKNGELRRVDFMVTLRDRAVLAEIEARKLADAEWRPRFAPEQRPPTPVAQAAAASDASRVITIGGTSLTLAEMLAPAQQNAGALAAVSSATSMAPSPGMTPTPFAPGVRSMLVVGLLDGVLSLNTEKGPNRFAVSPGTAFERELTRLSGSFADGRGRYAGRGALFVKGQVVGDIGITVAYDSEKTTGTTVFRDIQPDAFYPVTGDSSRKIFDAQSSSRFYARVEHGRSFGLFGDIIATTLEGDARRLGAFNRALTGVQSRVEAGRVKLTGFASQTALRQVVDEIAALGLSGPYSVSHPNGVSGSERVEILTRDRNQRAVVLQSLPMTRLTDYEFEPFTGRLLFRRPIPSLDERLNPVSIRVTYEIDTTLDGADPNKAWVGGVDGSLRATKRIEFGGAWIDDNTTASGYRLRSVNSTIRFGKSTTLIVEGADSRGSVGTGAALTTIAAATAEGAAARLELKHHSSRLLARAFIATAEAGFVNPSAGLTPGRTEAGASAIATITPAVKITADAVHSEDLATGATRDGAMVAVDATIARALGIEVGVRRSSQSATDGATAAAFNATSTDGFGLGAGGTAIDPVSGLPLSRPGLTSTLSAIPSTPTPAIDETTVRAKVVFIPTKRTNVYAEAEQDIRESAKRMAAVGLQVQVSTLNRAYARHEFISSLDSPYALTGAVRRDATVIGLASAVTSNSDVFSEYRMHNAIDGREAEAAIGLRNQWTLAEGLHVSTSLERLQAVAGARRESTAATGGLDFTRLQSFKATTRLEWRQDLTTQSWLSTLGIAERLSSSWTLLARNYYQWVQQRSAAGQMQNRFSIGGAFRSANSNRLNMLSRYELRVDRTFGAPDTMSVYRRVQSVSTHVDYQPARGWSLSGQHAAKWVDDRTDGNPEIVRAQLLSGRLGVDIFSRLDVGALGSVMWGSSGGREQALGAEVGVLLRGNWWLSFGDNAVGFRDTDFDIANTTTRGPFTRLRLKFD